MELRAPHRGNFLMWRKLPKTHKEPLGSLTSDRKGALPPLDSPSDTSKLCDKRRGNVTKWLWGKLPPEVISKRIPPLWYVFASFLRKKKGCAGVGCIAPHQQSIKFNKTLGWGKTKHSVSKVSFSKPSLLWAHAAHTVTLPPLLAGSFVIDEGERHEVTVGEGQCFRFYKNKVLCHCPQEWN